MFDLFDVPNGNYRGDVYDMSLSGLNWNQALDADNPDWYWGVPRGSEVQSARAALANGTGSPEAVSRALAAFYAYEQGHDGRQWSSDGVFAAEAVDYLLA